MTSSPRSTRPWAGEPDLAEHRDRARLDSGFPRGADALSELAGRAALRALRRRVVQGLRRARPGRVLPAAAHGDRSAPDLPTPPCGHPRGGRVACTAAAE